MPTTFDHIATSYDQSFTHTSIGQFQRNQVWQHLQQALPTNSTNILEINCGTGEDALFFASQGHQVTATDISLEMVEQTRQKALKEQVAIHAQVCSIQDSPAQFSSQTFDLIFSNFGGINCVSPEDLAAWAQAIPDLLSPSGKIIAVIMPRFCLWETLAFLKKGQIKDAFRRSSSGAIMAGVGEEKMPIWYYSPKQIQRMFAQHFQVTHIVPVGFFLPPSYLEAYFTRKPHFLQILNTWEHRFQSAQWLSSFSDHFLIEMTLI